MKLLRPLALGVATGSRTTMGLAAVSWSGAEISPVRAIARAGHASPVALAGPGSALTSPWGRRATAVGLLGELTVDKLPMTPSRLQPPALIGRLVAGLVCAAALADRDRLPLLASLGMATIGVGIGAFGGSRVRGLAKRHERPDLPVALAEDAVALSLAYLAVRR